MTVINKPLVCELKKNLYCNVVIKKKNNNNNNNNKSCTIYKLFVK